MIDPHDTDSLSEAPLLRSIPKADPFVVPDGFFDRFPMQVQAAISAQPSGWRALLQRVREAHTAWRVSAAAIGLALAVYVVKIALTGEARPATEYASNELSADELLALGVRDDDLIAALPDLGSEPGWAGSLSEEELSAYLEQDELALDLIIEEL
jgi:hypothetical protein